MSLPSMFRLKNSIIFANLSSLVNTRPRKTWDNRDKGCETVGSSFGLKTKEGLKFYANCWPTSFSNHFKKWSLIWIGVSLWLNITLPLPLLTKKNFKKTFSLAPSKRIDEKRKIILGLLLWKISNRCIYNNLIPN